MGDHRGPRRLFREGMVPKLGQGAGQRLIVQSPPWSTQRPTVNPHDSDSRAGRRWLRGRTSQVGASSETADPSVNPMMQLGCVPASLGP